MHRLRRAAEQLRAAPWALGCRSHTAGLQPVPAENWCLSIGKRHRLLCQAPHTCTQLTHEISAPFAKRQQSEVLLGALEPFVAKVFSTADTFL